MKSIKALLVALFLANVSSVLAHSVCYRNEGAYVANVAFYDIWQGRKIAEARHLGWTDEYCRNFSYLDVEIRIEHYMFLGNATLRQTCKKVLDVSKHSWKVTSYGTTTRYRCEFFEL